MFLGMECILCLALPVFSPRNASHNSQPLMNPLPRTQQETAIGNNTAKRSYSMAAERGMKERALWTDVGDGVAYRCRRN